MLMQAKHQQVETKKKPGRQFLRFLFFFLMFLISHLVVWNVYDVHAADIDCREVSDADEYESKKSLIESKLGLLNRMLYKSSSAQRILEGENTEALTALNEAKNIHNKAKEMYASGCVLQAEEQLNEGLKQFQNASRHAVNKKRFDAVAKQRYEHLLQHIKTFSEANDRLELNIDSANPSEVNKEQITDLVSQAVTMAEQNDYKDANEILARAVYILEQGLASALHNKTLVHELEFESIEEEYEYALETNRNYQKLLELVLTKLEPESPRQISMTRLHEFNEQILAVATHNVEAGNIEQALVVLDKGNIRLIQSLSGVGLLQ